MKRLFIAIFAIVLLVVSLVASLPLLFPTDFVRNQIQLHLEQLFGREVSFRDDINITFNPFLGIELSEFNVANQSAEYGDKPLLEAETIKVKLEVISAIFGNVSISEYEIHRPRLNLLTTQYGFSNWQLASGKVKQAIETALENIEGSSDSTLQIADLGTFKIVDGTLNLQNLLTNRIESASNINGTISWPDTSYSIAATGTAIWRNENTLVQLTVEKPIEFLAGGESPLNLQFTSEPLTINFSGSANLLADLFFKGEVVAKTPSIARLAEFLKLDLGRPQFIGEWSAQGNLDATTDSALLKDALVSVGENQSTGVVRVAFLPDGKTKMDGTLAFGDVDLSSYLVESASNPQETLNSQQSQNIDVDLRISADSFNLGPIELTRVASAITTQDGNWKFDIGDAQAFGGNITASASATSDSENRQLIMNFTANNAEIGEMLQYIDEPRISLNGTGKLVADLRTFLPLKDSSEIKFSGSTSATLMNGSIIGLDFPAILEAQENGDNFQQVANSGGETAFTEMTVKTFITDSTASISQARIITEEMEIQIIGDLQANNGALALSAQEIQDGTPKPSRIIIGGTVFEPLVSVKEIIGKNIPLNRDTEDEPSSNSR